MSFFHKYFFCVIILVSISITGCEKSAVNSFPAPGPAATTPVLEEKVLTDVSYGIHPLQQMDIYLPGGRSAYTTPMIILVHGGEWRAGDKIFMRGYINYLKQKLPNLAFANINYRVVQNGNYLFPTQENDIATAIGFLFNMSDSLKYAKKFGIIGESAGAQLALLVAFKMGKPLFKAAVGFGAPSNLEEWYLNPPTPQVRPLLEEVTGGTPLQFPVIYQNATVLNFVSFNSPTTLIIHGSGDGLIPASYAEALVQKINNSGSTANLVLVPGESHTFTPAGFNILYQEIEQFLKTPNLFK